MDGETNRTALCLIGQMRLVQRSFPAARATLALVALSLACAALLLAAGGARAAFDSRGTAVLDLPAPTDSAAYGKRTLVAVGTGPDQEIVRLRANGSIDTGFGEGGRVQIAAIDLAVTADGKILVLGNDYPADSYYDPSVTRLLPDGSVDPSFGGGTIRVDFGGKYDYGARIAVDARGRVLVGGTSSDVLSPRGFAPSSMTIVRLRPGGAVDRGFGRDGKARFGGATENGLTAFALGPRGSIFAAPSSGEVFKLGPGGWLDRGFGEGGRADLWKLQDELGLSSPIGIEDIAVTKSGKPVIVTTDSYFHGNTHIYRAAALRLLPDGTLDRRFGREGVATGRVGLWFFAGSMLLQRNGRLVIAGSSQTAPGQDSAFAAIAFDARGRHDPTFGRHGRMRIDPGATWTTNDSIVPRPGGRALLVGWANGEASGGPRGLALALIDLYNGKHR